MNDPNTTTPTIILSGPTSGLGRALFEEFITQSYPVVGLGRDLQRIAPQAVAAFATVDLVEVDLGDADVLDAALISLRNTIMSRPGGPLVFVSNAGTVEPIGKATSLTSGGLERAWRINCLAPLMVAHTLTDIAREQNRRLLVLHVSTGAANRPIRGWQAYCTSKAAHKMALDVLAAENPDMQIVHFDPGIMDTSMQDLIRDQNEADMPEVELFRSYRTAGELKSPHMIAADLILLLKRNLP